MSRCYLYNVASQKKGLLTVRMYEEDLLDFAAACRLRGGTMSSIVHQYAHKVIFEEKQKYSQADFSRAMEFVTQEREEKSKSTLKQTRIKSTPKRGKTAKIASLDTVANHDNEESRSKRA
jgi:hypothetical protein